MVKPTKIARSSQRFICRFMSPPWVRWHSSTKTYKSVYVAGRKPADPHGKMYGPLVLANGGGVQFSSFKRWGDYSAMTFDPKDDYIFWFTQEYYVSTGSFNRRRGRGLQVRRPRPPGRG